MEVMTGAELAKMIGLYNNAVVTYCIGSNVFFNATDAVVLALIARGVRVSLCASRIAKWIAIDGRFDADAGEASLRNI